MNLGLDADLSTDESMVFYGHIHTCISCAEEYAQLGRLLKEIRQCPAPTAAHNYWDGIWDNVRRRALCESVRRTWWMVHRLHLAIAAVPLASLLVIFGFTLLGDSGQSQMALSEASSRHGMVMMSHPYADPGLALLAVSEGTLASYEEND
jgi:hypothetical protein